MGDREHAQQAVIVGGIPVALGGQYKNGSVSMMIMRTSSVMGDMILPAIMRPKYFTVIITPASNMKKVLFFIFVTFAIIPIFAFANYEADIWSYVFHLEYKQGTLAVDSGAKYPYDSIPEEYNAQNNAALTDFYGIVVSVKNKEIGRFGFNTPATTVEALGKSIMSIHAPYFADANRVAFYQKGGKHLFDVSVKGSSFCNDDNVCNANVGENSNNCPNDCLAILNTPPPAAPPSTEVAPITPPTTPVVTTPSQETAPIEASGVVQKTETASPKVVFSPLNIMIFVGSALLLLLIVILLRIRKHMD